MVAELQTLHPGGKANASTHSAARVCSQWSQEFCSANKTIFCTQPDSFQKLSHGTGRRLYSARHADKAMMLPVST